MKFPTKLSLFLILCAGLCAGTLSACGEQLESGGEKGEDGHSHTYVETEVPATCDKAGEKSFTCSVCGEKKGGEVIPALGHSFEVLSHKDPTCTEEGFAERKCSRCGKTESETLPANGHRWGKEQILKAATCEEDGLRSVVCLECGTHENDQVIPALKHQFEEISHQDPTCTADGCSEKKCSRCGKTETETISASGHVAGERKTITESTCSKEGSEEVYCAVCKALMETESIPKKEHTFGEWTLVREATCAKEGEEKRACEVCHFEETRSIERLRHRYQSEFTFDKLPTYEEEGEKSKHCLNPDCDARVEVTKIEKLKENTDFQITLRNSLGEGIPSEGIPEISFYDGDQLQETKYGYEATVTLPTKNYQVKVSGLPVGYQPAESYEITPYEPARELRIPASLILEEKLGVTYNIGSIIYNRSFTVYGFTEAEDYECSFEKLLKDYKAILLNMYFTTCGACVYEMPSFVEAYNQTSSTGKKFGEEVACVMLDSSYDTVENIRKFKKQTNFNYSKYPAANDIPMMMIHDAWLTNYFARKITYGYPTSILIDCEGRIVDTHIGACSVTSFVNLMSSGIDRYTKIHAWRVHEGLESEQNTLFVRYHLLPAECKRLGT